LSINGLIVLVGNSSLKEFLGTKACWIHAVLKDRWYKNVCRVRRQGEIGGMIKRTENEKVHIEKGDFLRNSSLKEFLGTKA
jgi:hypothetical protein